MDNSKSIKFNNTLLKAISLVVIGAFLFHIGFSDFAWAKTDFYLRPCPAKKDTGINGKLFRSINSPSMSETLSKPPFLRALEFSEEDFRKSAENEGLLEFRIHVVRECNIKCTYCLATSPFVESAQEVRHRRDDLTIEKKKSVIAEAKSLGAKTVVISGPGESLLYPNLDELIAYINSLGLQTVIFTNALLLNEEQARYFYNNNVSLIVKLNSLTPEIQDRLAGGIEGTYDKFKKQIQMLINIGFTADRRLCINSVIVRDNYEEIPELFKFCRDNGIIPWVERLSILGRAKEEMDVSNDEIRELYRKIHEIDKNFGYDWDPSRPILAADHRRYQYVCQVTTDGYVYTTDAAPTNELGNIKSKSLAEIIKAPVFAEYRRKDKHNIAVTKNNEDLKTFEVEGLDLCKQIYNLLSSRKYRFGQKHSLDTYEKLLKKLLPMVTINSPIELLQFWGGSKNPHLPTLEVELAEETTLDNLYELSCKLKKIYSPGLRINVLVGDGRVEEVNGIPKERTQMYVQGLKELITKKGYGDVFNIVTVSSCYERYKKDFRKKLQSAKEKVYKDVENLPEFPTLVKHARRNIFDIGLNFEQIRIKSIKAAKDYVVYRVAEEEAGIFRDFDHCIRGFFIKYTPYYRRYIEKEATDPLDTYFVFFTGEKGNRVQPWQAIGKKDTEGKIQFLSQRRLRYVDLKASRDRLKGIAKYPLLTDEMAKKLPVKQSFILYAEQLLDNGGIIDAEDVLRVLHNNVKLGKIFIFAQDPGKAKVLENLINDINAEIETITVTKEILKKELRLKRSISEVEEINALIKFAKRNEVEPKNILSIVKGKAENLDELKKLSNQPGIPPILLFKPAEKNNLYSLASGLELILSGQKGVIFLTPIPITQDIEKEIEDYNNSLELYSAS